MIEKDATQLGVKFVLHVRVIGNFSSSMLCGAGAPKWGEVRSEVTSRDMSRDTC